VTGSGCKSPRRPWFAPGSVHVGFLEGKVSLGQAFLGVLQFFPVSIIPPWLYIWGWTTGPLLTAVETSHPIDMDVTASPMIASDLRTVACQRLQRRTYCYSAWNVYDKTYFLRLLNLRSRSQYLRAAISSGSKQRLCSEEAWESIHAQNMDRTNTFESEMGSCERKKK
jgi:hypothetical protein